MEATRLLWPGLKVTGDFRQTQPISAKHRDDAKSELADLQRRRSDVDEKIARQTQCLADAEIKLQATEMEAATFARKRQQITAQAYLMATLEGEEFAEERYQGTLTLWGLCSQRDHIEEFPRECVAVVVKNTRDTAMRTRYVASMATWTLAPYLSFRRYMADHGCVENLVANIRDVTQFLRDLQDDDSTDAWKAALGTLGVMAVDRECRAKLLDVDPSLHVFVTFAKKLAETADAIVREANEEADDIAPPLPPTPQSKVRRQCKLDPNLKAPGFKGST